MSYVKQDWKDLPNQTTPVNATRMNHIEQGVYDNSVAISSIVESGSNSNGNWIKYSDGTMICTGKRTFTGGVSTSLPNGGYRTSGQTIQFPINFSLAPDSVVASSLSDTNDNGFIINSAQVTKTSFAGFWWVVNSTYDNKEHSLSYIAIGRWK